MNVKMTFLLMNCFSFFLLCQISDALRNDTHTYQKELKRVSSVNREDKSPCTSKEDCNHLGVCRGNPGEKYCDCFDGISGKNCEIIDECVDNPDMCGNDPDVSCEFHRKKKRAICECETFGKRFDVPTKTCVDRKTCQSYKQCYNGADCINEDYDHDEKKPRYCECKFGTSGDFCERVEECIASPDYCGNGTDVECRYNTYLERAYCQCKDQNQRFDWPLKKCVDRKKCRTNEDCLPFGVCHNKCKTWEACLDYHHIEDKNSCHCVEGTSGERCEVIDDCHNKVVDCGTSDDVTCDYRYIHSLVSYAFCRCKDRKMAFDHRDKQCKECDCGPTATSCSFRDGVKTCTCHLGSYNHGDRCEDCKCGKESNGCTFLNEQKICNCNPGYKQTEGVCEQE